MYKHFHLIKYVTRNPFITQIMHYESMTYPRLDTMKNFMIASHYFWPCFVDQYRCLIDPSDYVANESKRQP